MSAYQTPAHRWIELIEAEDALARDESYVTAREAEVADRERIVEQEARDVHGRLESLTQRVVTLARAGSPGAAELMERLPEAVPPPGVSERESLLEARRRILDARNAGAEARERTATQVGAGLARVREELDAFEDEAARLQSVLAEADRQAESLAAEARARARREKAARSEQRKVPGAEHRLAPRVRLDCEVGLGTETNFYWGFARNLSTGGLFVATFDYLPVGTELDVAFSLPDGRRVQARAEVRWVREPREDVPEIWPGMGLAFEDLDPTALEGIEAFVEEREPLFFPE